MERQMKKASQLKHELQKLDRSEVRKAIVLNEILGKPKALIRKGR